MENSRQHFYFSLAIIVAIATGSLGMLEIINTTTDIALVEGTFYGIVKSGEARISSEIERNIQDTVFDVLEDGFVGIDEDINKL